MADGCSHSFCNHTIHCVYLLFLGQVCMSVHKSWSTTFKKPEKKEESSINLLNASCVFVVFFKNFLFFFLLLSNRLANCFTGLTTPVLTVFAVTLNLTRHASLSRWGNLICPGPLPSAVVTEPQQLVTSSHSHLLPPKVCLFTKPQQNATLTSAGTKPQSTDLDLALKDESPDWDWCSGTHVWVMLSPSLNQTGAGRSWGKTTRRAGQRRRWLSLGQDWANFNSCLIHFDMYTPDCECEGRWAETCQTLYGMHRLFINH